MDISERKIIYKERQRPKYIFDIIKTDPYWIRLLIEGKTFHGSFEFTDVEKKFYELVILKCPQTDIRINVDTLKDALVSYLQEPIFEDESLKNYTEDLYKSIEDYNKKLELGFDVYPLTVCFAPSCDSPFDSIWTSRIETLIPNLEYNALHYISRVQQRLQGLRSKYKHGKLSDELYDSEERLRNKIQDMRNDFNSIMKEYGKELKPYFDEWIKYRDTKREVYDAWQTFNSKCHYHQVYMGFGRYCNKSVSYVIRKDPGYIKWVLKNKPDFILKGDDLEEFIEKTGYDPYAISTNTTYPSNETIVNIASLLGDSDCELDSIVFKVSNLPDTKVLVSLTEKYPCLRYNLYSKENQYYISFSGTFEDSTMNKEVEKISEESESSSEIKVKELY
jgi:hypothetical protein